MEAIKQFFRQFTRTTPFVLANIMIVVPYLLFIHLLDFSSSISAFILYFSHDRNFFDSRAPSRD